MKYQMLILILMMLFSSCVEEPPVNGDIPPYEKKDLKITVEYISSIKIALRCNAIDSVRPLNLELQILEASVRMNFNLFAHDTVIVISDLEPNTEYHIILHLQEGNKKVESSDEVVVTTLGFGNRSFTWTKHPWPKYGTKVNGVHVINDSCVYVVGKFQDENDRGASIGYWNGHKWERYGVPLVDELYSVWTSGGGPDDDIWISSRGGLLRTTRRNFGKPAVREGAISYIVCIWGNRANNVWFAGDNGIIAHWDGSTLEQKIVRTDHRFISIIGSGDSVVYAVGVLDDSGEGALFKYDGSKWEEIMDFIQNPVNPNMMDRHMKTFLIGYPTLWVDETGALYAGGDYLYMYKNEIWSLVPQLKGNSPGSNPEWRSILGIAGWNSSDYFVTGHEYTRYHFNGMNFSVEGMYDDPQKTTMLQKSISVGGNTVCIVGMDWDPINRGYILRGVRR